MEIDTTQTFAPLASSEAVKTQPVPDDKFSSFLEADLLALKTKSDRDEVLAHQQPLKTDENKDDIEYIQENGMSAYVEEVHKLKLEELRAKILEMMGLTEEMLGEMSAEQRQLVEKAIAQEIQDRLAAASIKSNDPEDEQSTNPENTATQSATATTPQNLLAAQILAGDPGSMIGMVISDAEQNSNELRENSSSRDNSDNKDNT